jgi:hypothetical protein
VSASHVVTGQALHVSGTGCLPGVQVDLSLGEGPGGNAFFLLGSATTAQDGIWRASLTVEPGFDGPAAVEAHCSEYFDYTHSAPVTVSSAYHLTVLPSTTVAPGSLLTIEPDRSFCFASEFVSIGVTRRPLSDLSFPDPMDPVPVAAHAVPIDKDGSRTVEVQLPPSIRPGPYYVIAGCAQHRAPEGRFAPTPITVT